MADRLSGYFVVGMLVGRPDPPLGCSSTLRAVGQGVALLVVTCPCALGLVTPLTLTIAWAGRPVAGCSSKGGDAVQQLGCRGIMFQTRRR